MTTSGTSFKQRDVVLVPFPFSDLTISKHRPALVLSPKSYNDSGGDLVICAITSQPSVDHVVEIKATDMENGKLPKPSRVKPKKLAVIQKNLVAKIYGRLNKQKSQEVVNQISSVINIVE